MSDKAAGVVLSRSCVPVEWLSYFLDHHPQAHVTETDVQRIPVVDEFVREVRDLWIYEVLERVATKTVMVSREIYIDGDGDAFFAQRDDRATPPLTPLSPVKDRSPKINLGGAAGPTISCPQTDEDGKALLARLYCSRFRLPSRAVKKLQSDRRVVAALRDHVAPLWEWEDRINEASPLISSDGYSLVETPLYFAPGAKKAEDKTAKRSASFQVWVGADPLTLAESRGAVYLDARQEHLDKFQPDTKGGRDRISRVMLARLLQGAIIKEPSVKKKYAKYLRDTAITKAVKADKDQARAAVRKYEQAAARLCKVLDSALFSLVMDAATDDELGEECVRKNPKDPPRSRAVSGAVSALGSATMLLEESRAGRALLWNWNDEAEKHPKHFVNRIVLPALDPNKATLVLPVDLESPGHCTADPDWVGAAPSSGADWYPHRRFLVQVDEDTPVVTVAENARLARSTCADVCPALSELPPGFENMAALASSGAVPVRTLTAGLHAFHLTPADSSLPFSVRMERAE